MNTADHGLVLFEFSHKDAIGCWEPVDDVVMGGRSQSRILTGEDGGMTFTGRVSFEHGGGFASIRSRAGDFQTGGSCGLLLTLRGDGKRYRLSVRCDRDLDGISYQAPLPTVAGTRQTLRIPWSALRPSYHGQLRPEQPPVDPRHIRRFGLLIADRQEGPFRLDIYRIETYQEAS